MVERLTALIVKTSLPGRLSGSATETDVMSCCCKVSVSSPTGSVIAVTPGSVQAPVASRRGVTGSDTMLLAGPSPVALWATIL